MEELLFEDYIKPNMECQADASTIKTLALKQISRGRFEIADNICKVKILLSGDEKIVIFSNAITTYEFGKLVSICSPTEPSLGFLHQQIDWSDEPLLVSLNNYQNQFYKLGTAFASEYWYKLYSKTKIEDGMRELYQASWIDYEEQLKNGTIIHDELGVCGLWAMPDNMLLQCFNKHCKELYGDRVFVLKTVPECRYINDGKEIIGDKFEVVSKYDLNSNEDVLKICEHMIAMKNKSDAKISELDEKIRSLEDENNEALNNQTYLIKKINKYKLISWCFLLIWILCRIIICKFM